MPSRVMSTSVAPVAWAATGALSDVGPYTPPTRGMTSKPSRTKSAYYTARTAQVYSRAIDDAVAGRDFDMAMMDELEGLANRGYTEGFYRRHPPKEYQNYERGVSAYKVRKHVHDSLERLQTDRIDLYQVHHFDRSIALEEFWGMFEKLVTDGKVLYMGSSNFPGWGLAKFQAAAMQRGFLGLISEQTMYSLLCRWPELEVIPAALDLGIGVIPYMPLAGGILTAKEQSEAGSRTAAVEAMRSPGLICTRFTMGLPLAVRPAWGISWTLSQ